MAPRARKEAQKSQQEEAQKSQHGCNVGNAGVTLIGHSRLHRNAPAILLGGRWYTGKQTYAYTDFGGGVNTKERESAQQGAFREFAEELLGQDEATARETAANIITSLGSGLVGGRPCVHKGYAMFIVNAADLVHVLRLPVSREMSALDVLFSTARQNDELTSIALVGLQEFVRGALQDGIVTPLSVRQLDGKEREGQDRSVALRHLLVGQRGSVFTIRDTLEAFGATQESTATPPETGSAAPAALPATEQPEAGNASSSSAPGDQPAAPATGKRRWNRNKQASEASAGYCNDAAAKAVRAEVPASESVKAEPPVAQTTAEAGHLRRPFVFDMETGDPDDVLTLLFLCAHPEVDLRAVTVMPGTSEQIALVRWLLQQMGLGHIRLGAQGWPANANKPVNLSTDFYRSFGRSPEGQPVCERADQVLLECCDERVTLVTGAPLTNLGDALKLPGFSLGKWVAQGGFAGEGVVPFEKQLPQFRGHEVFPTFNFGGNREAAEAALASTAITTKVCVSKNVCHGAVYDHDWHDALGEAAKSAARAVPGSRRARALSMMYKTMDGYLRKKPGGKKLHDPLALAVAIEESVCELAEVKLFCSRGKWGSVLCPGSGVRISIDYDPVKFQAALLQ
eukprot:TRINITY_DN31305_c0_g1_i1.p1 TRINITY_DN31305_c0_g1~~TRINITY_DN31305_c0_g1_i1.p1  ORF type:complete len:626 (+),score=97.81 TRINITY_DN31305_c0_g1_i1:125-2002(+)